MNNIHIVTKIQFDYENDYTSVLFATDNLNTAEGYVLKGNRVLPMLKQFYLGKLNSLDYDLGIDWDNLSTEDEQKYDSLYTIYNSKYEKFKGVYFRVDTIPFYLFNKNRY